MKIYAQNRVANYNYFIEHTIEAGIVLQGWEVKSIKADRVSIKEAYISTTTGNMEIVGMHISPLNTASNEPTNSLRKKRLLLNKKEINTLIGKISIEGYTLIPLRLYDVNGKIKIMIALAKGKKNYDKRETIKDREWQVQKARSFKRQ